MRGFYRMCLGFTVSFKRLVLATVKITELQVFSNKGGPLIGLYLELKTYASIGAGKNIPDIQSWVTQVGTAIQI